MGDFDDHNDFDRLARERAGWYYDNGWTYKGEHFDAYQGPLLMLRKAEPGGPSKTLLLSPGATDGHTEVWSGTIDTRDEFERMMVVVEAYAREHGLTIFPNTDPWPPPPAETPASASVLTPARPSFHDAIKAAGDLDQQLAFLEARLRDHPGDPNALHALADTFMRLGRDGEAVTPLLAVADFYAKDQFFTQARAFAERARKIAPDDPQILARVAAWKDREPDWKK